MDRKTLHYAVLTSVIGSIVYAWFVAPISEWIWAIATNSANQWLIDLVDAAYLTAAQGKREWLIVVLFLFFNAGVFGILLGTITGAGIQLVLGDKVATVKTQFRRQLQLVGLAIYTLAILFVVFNMFKLSFISWADMQLNTRFSQQLDALGPYFKDDEEKLLKSAWALMKTHKDYQKIKMNINEIAKRSNIILPGKSPL